jgi:hypothetical protein
MVRAQAPARARPAIIEVPGGASSIQEAIKQARPGDSIFVAPGQYYENIQFNGKGIVVSSWFARSRNPADIERTIIDGSRPTHPDTGTVVMFVAGEDSTAVLQGFTITGGTGTIWRDAGNGRLFREGGGILCDLSSPVIRFNHIIGNRATDPSGGVSEVGGGGIRCGFAAPTIEYNVIRDNQGRYGAGVVLFRSTSTFRHNLVADNSGGQGFGGAGVWVNGYLTRHAPSIIEHNTIVNNTSVLPDSTRRRGPLSGKGGGVMLGTIAEFRNSIVWGNSQEGGGAQLVLPVDASALIARMTIQRNLVQGGLDSGVTTPRFANAVFDGAPRFVDRISYALAEGSTGKHGGALPKGSPKNARRPDVGVLTTPARP